MTVLITGASGGIGYELAKLFAADGYNLVLIARNVQKLRTFAKATIIAKDLSHSDSPQAIYDELKKRNISVDLLVNNAGYGMRGFFHQLDTREQLEQLQLNIVTLTHLTRLFLPEMIKKDYGRILNVASTAAFQPGPLMAVYYASKAYVLSFSQALSNETKGTGVTVTALCPGPTRTGFATRANLEGTMLFKSRIMDADSVALAGYRGLMAGRSVVIPGLKNRILVFLRRFVPTSLAAKMAFYVQNTSA